MIIRKAKLSDAKEIAKVHVDSWKTTYKNIMPAEYLEKLSYEQRTKLWIGNISKVDNYVYVAENGDGEVIGFTDGGKRAENEIEGSGDLTSIYILEQFQGQGIGNKLVNKLFTKLKALGYEKIFVEVLDDNKSKFFYEKLGARLEKSEKIKIGDKDLDLLIYVWGNIDSVLYQTGKSVMGDH
ncbi:GNAT family N-acetyltransferase [Lysinibacillus cavernae]|uniref:GNAT family N-acetyltransferase n=1 Tax=Lysinibacillus cavernae TaxID=2666135 RepID=UPI0012D8A772|nr:GNAT family N-acetyltransferase [Lysinibacillus cavernae]